MTKKFGGEQSRAESKEKKKNKNKNVSNCCIGHIFSHVVDVSVSLCITYELINTFRLKCETFCKMTQDERTTRPTLSDDDVALHAAQPYRSTHIHTHTLTLTIKLTRSHISTSISKPSRLQVTLLNGFN